MESKIWRNDIKKGYFRNVICSIENNSKDISSVVYINLLIDTNNYLSKSQSITENVNDLTSFCITCCKKIGNLTPKLKETYLGVVYHIYKRLLDNGHFNYVLSLSEFLVHPWPSSCSNEKSHKEIYKSFFAITYNCVHREMSNDIKSEKHILVKKLTTTALKFASCAYPDSVDFLSKGCLFICMFEQQYKKLNNIQPQSLYDIFMEILNYLICVKYKFDGLVEDVFKHLINMTVPIITICLQLTKQHLLNFFDKIVMLTKENGKHNYFFYIEIFVTLSEEMVFNQLTPTLFQNLCDKLKIIYKKKTNNISLFCMKIYVLICNIFHHFSNSIDENLKLNEFLFNFSNFLFILQFNIQSEKIEKCKCNLNCLSYISQKYSIDILKLIIKHTLQSLQSVNGIHKKMKIFKKAFQGIIEQSEEILNLNCSLHTTMVEYVVIMFHNIMSKLTELKLNHELKEFFIELIENIFTLTKEVQMSQSVKKALKAVLFKMSHTYGIQKEYKEGLSLLAISIYLDKYDKETIKAWINLKYKSKTDNISEVEGTTIVSLLTDENLKHYLPKFEIETNELAEISMLELTAYHDLWPSENHIQAVCSEIMKYTQDPLQKGRAFMLTWNTLSNFVALKYHIDETINKLLLLNQDTSYENTAELKIMLANMLFCKYQYRINEIRMNSSENLDAYCVPLSSDQEKSLLKENKDKFFVNVKIEQELLSNLNIALDLWSSALEYDISEETKNKVLDNKTLQMIEMMPAIYELHGHHLHKLKSFSVVYKYAELFSNMPLMIQFLGRILESLDFNSTEAQIVIKKANILIKSMKSSPDLYTSTDLIEEAIILFKLSESLSCFLSKEYKSGYKIFKEVNETYRNCLKAYNPSIGIKIDYLKMKYSGLPCSFNIDDHQNNSFPNLKSFYEIKTSFNTSKLLKQCKTNNILILNQMFDFALELGNTYICLYLPREARCCLRSQVTIAHSLGLPLRSIQLLNLLSHVDIVTSRIEDCQIKLKYINKLLCLSKQAQNSFEFLHLLDTSEKDYSSKCIVLDFLQHSYNCKCYDCSNILYQQLVLEFCHIGVKLKDSDVKNKTCIYFEEVLKIYSKILNKQKTLINNSNLMFPIIKSEDLKTNNSVKVNLSASYFKLLLDYTDMLMHHGNWQDALKKIEGVLKFVYGFEELLCYQVINAIELNCAMLQVQDINDVNIICEKLNSNVVINEVDSNHVKVSKLKQSVKNVQNNDYLTENYNLLSENIQKTPTYTPMKQSRPVRNKSVSCFKIYTPVVERSTTRNLRSTQKKKNGTENLTVARKSVLNISPDIILCSPDTDKHSKNCSKKKNILKEDKKHKTSAIQKHLQNNISEKNDSLDDIIPLDIKI